MDITSPSSTNLPAIAFPAHDTSTTDATSTKHATPAMDTTSVNRATCKDWLDIMKNRSKVRMHELIERLGLRAKWSFNKRGKTHFESTVVREMVADMGDLITTLPKDQDELTKFLSDPGSLKEEINRLLMKHGENIWGRNVDRVHLLKVNEPGVEENAYQRNLYFDVEEDRQQIHTLLHWWMGLKACNVILARERLDRERRKKAENRQARAEVELAGQNSGIPASFVALAPNSVFYDTANTTSRGSTVSSSTMLMAPESGESPLVGPREGHGFTAVNGALHAASGNATFNTTDASHLHTAQQSRHSVEDIWNSLADSVSRESSILPEHRHRAHAPEAKAAIQQQIVDANQAAVDRQISVEVAKLVASLRTPDASTEEIPQPANSIPYRGLDDESLREFRQYIYKEDSSTSIEEEALLNRLELAWREGVRADYHQMVENLPVFMARERAILTWLELKRHLAALERAGERWRNEGHSAPEIERRIQQHRTLMGCTQTLIANFEDVDQGLGPHAKVDRDELLRQAILVLAGEKHAAGMQWPNVEFSGLVRWLREELEMYQKDEEQEGLRMSWYVR